jgi:hypothetical protein
MNNNNMNNKAKVIGKKARGPVSGRKWPYAAGIIVLLLLFAMAMPLSEIPGFGRLAGMLGLSPDALRSLTLTDLAAYAAGLDGNRVSVAQYAGGGYLSAYAGRGGLSPLTMGGANRLLDAEEAYRREYELYGKYSRLAGPLSMAQTPGNKNPYEGVALGGAWASGGAPLIDSARAGEGGEYGPEFGGPLGADGRGEGGAGFSGADGDNGRQMLKPAGSGNISGVSRGANPAGAAALQAEADAFKGGRLGAMGGFNAAVNRVNLNVGQMGSQYAAFGELGRSFYFTGRALGQGYKTAAKQLAEAAFDGSEEEPELMLVPGEEEERTVNTLMPNSLIDKFEKGKSACGEARKVYGKTLNSSRETLKNLKKRIAEFDNPANNGGAVPGCCSKLEPKVTRAQERWDALIDELEGQCVGIFEAKKAFAGQCGLAAAPTSPVECKDLKGLKIEKCPIPRWMFIIGAASADLTGGAIAVWAGICRTDVRFQNSGAVGSVADISACKGENKQACADSISNALGKMLGIDLSPASK